MAPGGGRKTKRVKRTTSHRGGVAAAAAAAAAAASDVVGDADVVQDSPTSVLLEQLASLSIQDDQALAFEAWPLILYPPSSPSTTEVSTSTPAGTTPKKFLLEEFPHQLDTLGDIFAYKFFLQTHVLQKLIVELPKPSHQSSEVASLGCTIAKCSWRLSHLFPSIVMSTAPTRSTSSKYRLERIAQGPARHLLGRAILACTVASAQVLVHVTASIEKDDRKGKKDDGVQRNRHLAIVYALLTLDTVMSLQMPGTQNDPVSLYWKKMQNLLSKLGQELPGDSSSIDNHISKHHLDLANEAVFYKFLLSRQEEIMTGESLLSSGGGRQSTRKGGNVQKTLKEAWEALDQLVDDLDKVTIDGKLASKRWSHVTLVWLLRCEQSLLQTVNVLLTLMVPLFPDLPLSGDDYVKGKVVVMALVGRLLRLVKEASSLCGTKSSAAGLEHYVSKLLVKAESETDWDTRVKRKTKKSSKRATDTVGGSSEPTRPDIRDLSTLVMYKWIKAHTECLSSIESTSQIVNDETWDSNHMPTIRLSFYPFAHSAIKDLTRTLGSNSPGGAAGRVEGIAYVFFIQALHNLPYCSIDAQLAIPAITKMSECLSLANEKELSDTDVLQLYIPLPSPVIETQATKSRKRGASDNAQDTCTFAGMYSSPSSSWTGRGARSGAFHDELLFSFLRALSPSRSNGFKSFFCFFLDVIEKSHGAETTMVIRNQRSTKSSRKRKAGDVTFQRKKRRKRDTDAIESIAEAVDARSKMSKLRVDLTLAILRTLEKALDSNDRPLNRIRGALRASLSLDHILRIVKLGNGLESFLQKVGLRPFPSGQVDDSFSCYIPIWDKMVDLSVAVGSGRKNSLDAPRTVILGENRVEVFKMIASYTGGMQMKSSGSFPLWLTTPHRRLIATNLVFEPLEDKAGDLFLVKAYIAGITEVFDDLLMLIPSRREQSQSFDLTASSIEEGVPMSLENSRIMAAAMARLDEEDRMKYLSSLLKAVEAGVRQILREKDRVILSSHVEVSSFLGRVVCTCTSICVALTCSQRLVSALQTILYNSDSISFKTGLFERFSERNCFLSIFGDGGASEINTVDLAFSNMPSHLCSRLQRILEGALSLGMSTGGSDRCYLVFASWSCLGKSELWTRNLSAIPFSSLPDDLPKMCIELRNDLCYVSRIIRKANRGTCESALQKLIDQREHAVILSRKSLLAKVKTELKAMVSKGCTLLDELLTRYESREQNFGAKDSSSVFVLLEMICAYLSFAVAACTKPKVDFFQHVRDYFSNQMTQKRSRADSSDSEAFHSDDVSTEDHDALTSALERFTHVCSRLSSVPSYPDWLDSDCDLMDLFTHQEAFEMATLVLDGLCRLATKARSLSLGTKLRAVLEANDPERAFAIQIAFHLCHTGGLLPSTIPGSPNMYEETLKAVESMIGCDSHVARLWMDKYFTRGDRQLSSETWLKGLSVRTNGSLFELIRKGTFSNLESPQMRAAGEWELLLSSALSSIGLGLSMNLPAAFIRSSSQDAFKTADRWQHVYASAMEAIIPVSALIHFSLNKTGRSFHPLKSCQTVIADFDYEMIHMKSTESSALQSLQESTAPLLLLLSDPSDVTSRAEVIAANLFIDHSTLSLVRGAALNKIVLDAFAVAHMQNESLPSTMMDALSTLFGFAVRRLGWYKASIAPSCPELSYSSAAILADEQKICTLTAGDFTLRSVIPRDALDVSYCAGENYDYLKYLVRAIHSNCSYVRTETRHHIIDALCHLNYSVSGHGTRASSTLALRLVDAFNSLGKNGIVQLVEKDICEIHSNDEATRSRFLMCSMFSIVLSFENFAHFEYSNSVYTTLEKNYGTWSKLSKLDRFPVLNLLLLYSTRCSKLGSLGSRLISAIDDDQPLEDIDIFVSFVRELHERTTSTTTDIEMPDQLAPEEPLELPNLCSHKIRAGFRSQHWYHCATCGLVGDKGCCTICALICHVGHDVSYSRYSAFFCDCGAEGGPEGTSSFTCRCLQPLEVNRVARAFAAGRGEIDKSISESRTPFHHSANERLDISAVHGSVSIASRSFMSHARRSLHELITIANKTGWWSIVLDSTEQAFRELADNMSPIMSIADDPSSGLSFECLRLMLASRKETVAFQSNGAEKLAFKSQIGPLMSGRKVENESNQKWDLTLTGSVFSDSRLDADSRGRLAAVEQKRKIVLGSCLPVLLSSSADNASALGRTAFTTTGTVSADFDIVGLNICKTCENSIVVWGVQDAAVCVLDEGWLEREQNISLGISFGSTGAESNFLTKCDWFPGSATCLFAASKTKIALFDLNTSDGQRNPAVTIELSSEGSFCGIEAVDIPSDAFATSYRWNLFALTNNGHLYSVTVTTVAGEPMKVSRDKLESKHSVKLPVCGDDGVSVPQFSLTFGEASSLSYLPLSRLLLYQAVAEKSVLAFQVDSAGKLRPGFTLISSEMSPPTMIGPFDFWTELGAVKDGPSSYFRVACVAKRPEGGDALLCLEFNERDTRVAELTFLSQVAKYDAPILVRGLTATTIPRQVREVSKEYFVEKVVLVAYMSNRSLCLFEEVAHADFVPMTKMRRPLWLPTQDRVSQDMPLLIFEELTVVPESDVLVRFSGFGDDCFLDENNSIRGGESTVREGFNFSVRIDPDADFSPRGVTGSAIVAFRFSVGDTSLRSIPSAISVGGREIHLDLLSKKTYCCHLTLEEIAVSMRNGFVSVIVSPAHDKSSQTCIDSFDCFCVDLSKVLPLLPRYLNTSVARQEETERLSQGKALADGNDPILLRLRTLAGIGELTRPLESVKEEQRLFLQELLRFFALDEDQILSQTLNRVLDSCEMNEESQGLFRDSGLLMGCTDFLTRCQEALRNAKSNLTFEAVWQSHRQGLSACFRKAVSIAKRRPFNYLQSTGQKSPGRLVGSFFAACFDKTSTGMELIPEFVEMCLVEMAAATVSGENSQSPLITSTFDGIKSLLVCSKERVAMLASLTISRFCGQYVSFSPSVDLDCDLFSVEKLVAYYRCDGCGLFPIKDKRYSVTDESRPFDLCSECYRKAHLYASAGGINPNDEVNFDGCTIGDGLMLLCADVLQMKSVEIPNDETRADPKDAPGDRGTEFVQRQQLFDDFMDGLFAQVLDLLVSIEESSYNHASFPHATWLAQLAVSIVHYSGNSARRIDRSKKVCVELIRGLVQALQKASQDEKGDGVPCRQCSVVVVERLRLIAKLVVFDEGAFFYLGGIDQGETVASSSRDVTCDVHGVAACKKKCLHGPAKNKEFFCCSKDAKSRCNFFLWTEEASLQDPSREKRHFNTEIASVVWRAFTDAPNTLVAIVECIVQHIRHLLRQGPLRMAEKDALLTENCLFSNVPNEHNDGFLSHRSRLRYEDRSIITLASFCHEKCSDHLKLTKSISSSSSVTVIKIALSVLSLIASGVSHTEEVLSLMDILCELIISLPGNTAVHEIAKRSLAHLCSSKKSFYVTIRAHHTFVYGRDKLLAVLAPLFRQGVIIREKARQCGPFWKSGQCQNLTDLKAGDFIGTEDLISEDARPSRLIEEANRTLGDLLTVAKKRSGEWRKFCSHLLVSKALTSVIDEEYSPGLSIPPLSFLFMAGCVLDGESSVRAFRLVEMALDYPVGEESTQLAETSKSHDTAFERLLPSSTPIKILNLSVDQLFSFTIRFGCYGESHLSRLLACSIISTYCTQSDAHVARELFSRLILMPIKGSGVLGRCLSELLSSLHRIGRLACNRQYFPDASRALELCWRNQLYSICFNRANKCFVSFETRNMSSVMRKRYDFFPCVYCQRMRQSRKDKAKTVSSASAGSSQPESSPSQPGLHHETTLSWLPQQVTPCSRGRIEGWRQDFASDTHDAYSALKYRLVLSEVHLEVNDPRGRFVKEITIYTAPRPVREANELKGEAFRSKWERCGQISLPKGATRGSCKLNKPVVAANLRFEYSEFYERAGGKPDDGSFVVHCPRCSRVVTNAHGVCGNCGEVAFQCRKCRHINYDRLDAFLCVECGYCAAGTFIYEVTAAVASNAIAVTNDVDFERTCNMFAVAVRLYEDLRSALRDKLSALLDKDTGPESAILKRAFVGGLPLQCNDPEEETIVSLSKLGKKGSAVRAIARPHVRVLSNSRAHSLARLGRDWREATSSRLTRRSGSDIIIHQLAEEDDDSAELFGLLEGTATSRGPDDPLARLLTSVQNRNRERRAANGGTAISDRPTGGDGLGGNECAKSRPQISKESLDVCDRLYSLMREAEREAFCLEARIDAWKRLESGSLLLSPPTASSERTDSDPLSFQPSHCSACAGSNAVQLMSLWGSLLDVDPDKVEVTRRTIQVLLKENFPQGHRVVLDAKYNLVKDIALKSKEGSQIVLEELEKRLRASESVVCAEILGKIIEEGGSKEFFQLALEVLDASEVP